MSDSPEQLTALLSDIGAICPICSKADWAVPSTSWQLPASGDGAVLPLLRAICLSCGYLAWFHEGVPEIIPQ